MDDSISSRRGSGTAHPAWMPWAIGALGVAALAQVGARLAPDWYRIFGPYLLVDADMVVGAVRGVSPFVLAAAVLVGARRWPAGTRWLHLGALALGLQGLLELGSDIWWAIWNTAPGEVSGSVQLILVVRFVASTLAGIAAWAFLAGGLWTARGDGTAGGARRVAALVIGLVGLAALGSGIWVAAMYLGIQNVGSAAPLYAVDGVLVAIGIAAPAALAFAAVRAMPERGRMPEVLIAVGATLAAGALAWEWVFPQVSPLTALSFDVGAWVFTLMRAVVTASFMAMIAGFGVGALARESQAGADRTPG